MITVTQLPNAVVRASLVEDGREVCTTWMYHPRAEKLNSVKDNNFMLDAKRYSVNVVDGRIGKYLRIERLGA